MVCIYRTKKYGANFCSKEKKHCSVVKLLKCVASDLMKINKR